MNNNSYLSYLFGAFALVTIVFFIHNWAMSSRQHRLEKKLEELKAQLKDKI
jgi:ABC-type amino acid transport system permease subunit